LPDSYKPEKLAIDGVTRYIWNTSADARGEFTRHFSSGEIGRFGSEEAVVQANLVWTSNKLTFRGMHYQVGKFQESKLVSCLLGEISVVVVDVRFGSPTFLRSLTLDLSQVSRCSILIPRGVATGYLTRSDDVLVHYYSSAPYAKDYERGFRFDDPMVNIELPFPPEILSDRDKSWLDLNRELLHQESLDNQ
jgi:dTDP-4-dehydrorhamnose 3,5-epimerase